MVKAKGKAGAKSAGFCMYIGPSIVGTIPAGAYSVR